MDPQVTEFVNTVRDSIAAAELANERQHLAAAIVGTVLHEVISAYFKYHGYRPTLEQIDAIRQALAAVGLDSYAT